MADKTPGNGYKVKPAKGEAVLRIRLPGGDFSSEELYTVAKIAEKYGKGTAHVTPRQGCEVPGISLDRIDDVEREIEPFKERWHPQTETRNVMACVGNRSCRYANYDTTGFAVKADKMLSKNEFIVKMAFSGCPNDCIKAHIQDIGVLGQVEPNYNNEECIACGSCVDGCAEIANALELRDKVYMDGDKCIGCGQCIINCPTGAMYGGKNYFKILIMGRTGKKNPRLAAHFISWAPYEAVMKIIENINPFIAEHVDYSIPKDRMGYIFDRTGYEVFKEKILRDAPLDKKTLVAKNVNFPGYTYKERFHLE